MTDYHMTVPAPVNWAPSGTEPKSGVMGERDSRWTPSRLVLGPLGSQRLGPRLALIACGWLGMLIGLAGNDWAGLVIGPGGFVLLAVWARLGSARA